MGKKHTIEMTVNKCLWCGSKKENMKPHTVEYRKQKVYGFICSDDCERQLESFVNYIHKYLKLSIAWYIFALVIGEVLLFMRFQEDKGALGYLFMGVMIGLNLIIFPATINIAHPAPKTAVKIARVTGVVFILVGVVAWYFLRSL